MLVLIVVAANVLGGAMALPQASKVWRERQTEGVSTHWVGISIALNSGWALYAWGVGDAGIVPVSVVAVTSYLLIARALLRFDTSASITVMTVPAVAALVLPAAALAAGSWAAAGVVLGAMYGVQLLPAVVTVYRSAEVSGVSWATWIIGLAEAALWAVYGLARTDPGLATLGLVGSLMSALVLVRLALGRPRPLRTDGLALART